MILHNAVPTVVIVVSLIGAFIALRGSMIVIRNSMDDFMDDLKRQSRWATWAALAGCVAAGLTAAQSFWL
jgi:multisubunit Na+/H+ antiporter MnhG subunit